MADECHLSMEWRTRLACAPVIQECRKAHDDHVFNLEMLSRSHGQWHTTDSDGVR